MIFLAQELKRKNISIPLLIGGATTSRKHTAIKIEENYSGPTIHVIDASRAVGVVRKLMNINEKEKFVNDIRDDFKKIRINSLQKDSVKKLSRAIAHLKSLFFLYKTISVHPSY